MAVGAMLEASLLVGSPAGWEPHSRNAAHLPSKNGWVCKRPRAQMVGTPARWDHHSRDATHPHSKREWVCMRPEAQIWTTRRACGVVFILPAFLRSRFWTGTWSFCRPTGVSSPPCVKNALTTWVVARAALTSQRPWVPTPLSYGQPPRLHSQVASKLGPWQLTLFSAVQFLKDLLLRSRSLRAAELSAPSSVLVPFRTIFSLHAVNAYARTTLRSWLPGSTACAFTGAVFNGWICSLRSFVRRLPGRAAPGVARPYLALLLALLGGLTRILDGCQYWAPLSSVTLSHLRFSYRGLAG